MPTLDLKRADGSILKHSVPDVAQDVVLLASATQFLSNKSLPNDGLFRLGDDGDIALVNRSTALAANTALTGVIVGTPATLASAANSLLIGNITASGDIHLIVNKAGTSHTAFFADGSTGDTIINAATGQSVDTYIAGVKQIDYSTGAMAFQQATIISSSSTLTFSGTSHVFTTGVSINTALSLTLHDNTSLVMGSGSDFGQVLFASTTSADEEVAGLILGTSNHQGTVADSLFISGLKDDSDIMIMISDGGNSLEMIKMTAATAELSLGWGALKIGFGELAAITRPSSLTDVASVITALTNLGLVT